MGYNEKSRCYSHEPHLLPKTIMKNRKEFKNVVRKKCTAFLKNLLYIYCDFIFSFLLIKYLN